MRKLIVLLIILISTDLNAQNNVSDKEHAENVKSSKLNGTAIRSKDTFFCSGSAKALVTTIEENLASGSSSQALYMPGTSDVLMIIEMLNYNDPNGRTVYYHHLEFPSVFLECDLRSNGIIDEVYSQICKNELFNSFGLDTNKAFIFTTLKGKIPETELKGKYGLLDTVKMMRSLMVKRNIKAEIDTSEGNIFQDNAFIGSFEEDSITGMYGKTMHIRVFNYKGVLICGATKPSIESKYWNLLTYKEGRLHNLKFKTEDDLIEILRYLINKEYL